MRCSTAAAALLAIVLTSAGCQLFGQPEIVCRNVDEATCQRFVATLLEEARRDEPGKQVVKLTIHGMDGSYDMVFSDGTSKAVAP